MTMNFFVKVLLMGQVFFWGTTLYGQFPSWSWAKQLNSDQSLLTSNLNISAGGDLYIGGRFSGTVDFDPGPGFASLTAFGGDAFILKLDTNGNYVWVKRLEGSGSEFLSCHFTDDSSNVYLFGTFTDSVDCDPGLGIQRIHAQGEKDIFLVKLGPVGNLIWAQAIGGIDIDEVYSVVLYQNYFFICGSFQGTVDFDPGSGIHSLSSNGSSDVFFVKFDLTGQLMWAKNLGGSGNDLGRSIKVDVNGNIFLSGSYQGAVDFNPDPFAQNFMNTSGIPETFILKLDSAGNYLFSKSIQSTAHILGERFTIDSQSNFYLTGSFMDTVDFNPDSLVENYLITDGSFDCFIAKYDSVGNYIWAKSLEGSNVQSGVEIKVDDQFSVYVIGEFAGAPDFDPQVNSNHYLTSMGGQDVFILKLTGNGDFLWARTVGGPSLDRISAITFDAQGGIYICGSFNSQQLVFDNFTLNNTSPTAIDYDGYISKLFSSLVEITEFNAVNHISIYPNPSTEFSIVSASGIKKLNLFDLNGKILKSWLADSLSEQKIDTYNYDSGMYFIQVIMENTTVTSKLFIQH